MDKNMMMQAMQAMQEMQKRMGEAQEKLKTMSVTHEGGNGLVKVTISGELKVTKIEIDENVRKTEEADVLEDLLITTINKAIESASKMKEQELAASTQGLLPNIPGMNLPFGM
ncbi:MAG: YbaB/EbfC family nucleoid-associated protein [Ignavibacteriae bacterium]|nr:YbaB/EbfC family nucleoid-associated protein [Ignavibacteriota bacterium]MCB9216421.1 YbaB/EbfC family nucleoid-associated protein [Ignavibacteria bacterium]